MEHDEVRIALRHARHEEQPNIMISTLLGRGKIE